MWSHPLLGLSCKNCPIPPNTCHPVHPLVGLRSHLLAYANNSFHCTCVHFASVHILKATLHTRHTYTSNKLVLFYCKRIHCASFPHPYKAHPSWHGIHTQTTKLALVYCKRIHCASIPHPPGIAYVCNQEIVSFQCKCDHALCCSHIPETCHLLPLLVKHLVCILTVVPKGCLLDSVLHCKCKHKCFLALEHLLTAYKITAGHWPFSKQISEVATQICLVETEWLKGIDLPNVYSYFVLCTYKILWRHN